SSYSKINGLIFDTNISPVKSEFLVNILGSNPRVSPLANSGFVVVWDGEGKNEYGGILDPYESYGVFGKLFNSYGVNVGYQFQINMYKNGLQSDGQVSTLKDNNFLVTWNSVEISGRLFSYGLTIANINQTVEYLEDAPNVRWSNMTILSPSSTVTTVL